MSGESKFSLSAKKLELLRAMRREQGLTSTRQERIARQPEAEAYPLSFSQQQLWVLDRLQPGSAAYNLPTALRLEGPLRPGALARALTQVVLRQATLRTVFVSAPENEGGAAQRISPPAPVSIPLVDLGSVPAAGQSSEVRRLLREEALRPFDLERGPLFRFSLLHLGEAEHVAMVTLHHVAADALSLEIFIRELSLLYSAALSGGDAARVVLLELPIRYVDFACWQREWARAGGLAEQLAHWRQRLAGAPTVLELPADRPRSGSDHQVAIEPLTLPAAVSAGLAELARQENATPFMAVFALVAELLRRHTGQDDLLVGSPAANRQRPDISGLIGFFVNTLVLRADIGGDPSFRELLGRARETALDAFAHQDVPFDRLVEELQPERRLGHMPLFQVMLALQTASATASAPAMELPELRVSRLPTSFGQARIDLAFTAFQGEGWLDLAVEYDADLFDATTMRRLLARLATLAAACVAAPDARLSAQPGVPWSERHQVLAEWNDRTLGEAEPQPEPLLHRLFEAQVAAGPDRPALLWDDTEVTYGELNRRANGLARHLRGLGVGPDAVVGLCMDRSPDLMAAILAVLKAGGAYLPLDPEAPAERTAFMLADAGVRVAVAGERLAAGIAEHGVRVLVPERVGKGEDENLAGGAGTDNLAYVIYTSGSTGKPKGVMIPHRGVCGTLLWRLACFALSDSDCILQNIAFTFDPSIWQIFGALLSGARLVPVPPGGQQDFAGLVRTAARLGVTITDLAPPMLEAFLDQDGLEGCDRLRLLFAGGQALPADLAARFKERFPAAALQNIYGPTEVAIDAATWTCAPLPAGRTVPIGRPVAGRRLLVLDRRLAPVPLGVPGELYIGGAGLARGYLGEPALTAERFLPDPWAAGPGERLYRTGDAVRHLADGLLEFLGRVDRQVKIRGFRVELGEVEAAVALHPAVREVAVEVRQDPAGQPRIAAWFATVPGSSLTAGELRLFLRSSLPSYMMPAALVPLAALPRTVSGKVDPQALPAPEEAAGTGAGPAPRTGLERIIAQAWREVLGVEDVGVEDNFFDRGGHSLLLIRVHGRLQKLLDREIPVVDLFNHPTIGALARRLDAREEGGRDAVVAAAQTRARQQMEWGGGQEGIAIVGLAGRFPGSADVEELWSNLRTGKECIRFFTDEELAAEGVPPEALADPAYVKAHGALDGIDLFDASFFDFTPREAEMTDPQHRLFLEQAYHALENAGYDPARYPGAIGVYAGVSANLYVLRNVLATPGALRDGGANQAMLGGEKDFLATRLSYKLNLRGPSFTVQTACSTSLVATHLACRALLGRECDMALAGGVSAAVPQVAGYFYQEGGINSPDGHCRAFDAAAQGTVGGSGVGVVVLKRLSDALAAGDTIHAVIRGTAINNDGSQKVGYTAPGVDGQAAVIAAAQALAGVSPDEIGYVEAHGTGTPLGDPIEIAALTRVFRAGTGRRGFCALGSVKTNLGHLDAAAGIAGLIKTSLVLKREEIPPSLHFREPNPRIDFASSPFFVNAELRPWPAGGEPRRAAVSSFGIGGTNAHAVLEEAPAPATSGESRPLQLLVLSARSGEALEKATANLAAYLAEHPGAPLADAAFTLQVGRRALAHRRVLVARDAADAAAALAGRDPERLLTRTAEGGRRPVVFLFPGQGAQYAGMGRELYEREPDYRAALDACAEILASRLGGLDLRRALHPEPGDAEAGRRLQETGLAQPALFAVEYALARLWMRWGVEPEAMLGHSLGEYVAACLAGVFSLEDALAVVAARGLLMQAQPAGAMLAVPLPEAETLALLDDDRLSLAAVNAAALCVISGPEPAVEAVRARLAQRGVEGRRLHTSHAFHSAAMDPILAPFRTVLEKVSLQPPRIPYLSNLTGTWIEPAQATDPGYWVAHLRQPVRFSAALGELLREPSRLLLEVGPGRTLASLARRQATVGAGPVESMRPAADTASDQAFLLAALGRLWIAGAEVDWEGFHAHERRRRVPLPLYPFERQRYWIEPRASARRQGVPRRPEIADWFSAPAWQESVLPVRELPPTPSERWLLLVGRSGLGSELAERLSRRGRPVVRVEAGESFERLGADAYRIHPGRREDYARLLREMRAEGGLPTRIVHLGCLTPEGAPTGLEGLASLEEAGFYSLLWLAQALAEATEERTAQAPPELELTVVANGLVEVTGEEALGPEKALLLGPVRVIPWEYPGARARAVDVVLPAPGHPRRGEAIDHLTAELALAAGEPVVALRGRRRWVERQAPVRLEAAGSGGIRLREGGVVLVTGGTGGIGLALAEHLARTAGARLALVSRSGLPAGSERLASLASLGAEVMVIAADVADEESMRSAVRQIRERFGALHGVIHAAGVPGGGLIQLKEQQEAAKVLRAKVRGTLVLEAALAPLVSQAPLDFFLVCSSLASIVGGLGQVDYCAANAFLDAFAAARRGSVLAIAWDRWREAGMAAASVRPELAGGLLNSEALEVFDRALASGLPRLAVSTRPLESLMAGAANSRRDEAPGEEATPAAARRTSHSRPDLPTPFVAPRTETEQVLAGIWQDVLGIQPVGIHDDFHQLGGHSLLALQVLSRIRQALGCELPLRAVFDAPTVAGLAVRLLEGETQAARGSALDDMLARLEDLSEEEAEALLAGEKLLIEAGVDRSEAPGD